MDVLTFETCWAVNSEIIKQVTSSWSIFIHYQDDNGPINLKIVFIILIHITVEGTQEKCICLGAFMWNVNCWLIHKNY